MEKIIISSNTVNEIYSDDLIELIQDLIHTELQKDEDKIDADFVEECVDALLKIQQEKDKSFVVLVPLVKREEFLRKITNEKSHWKKFNKFTRIALVAAIIASSTFTVNAAVKEITGVSAFEQIGLSQSKNQDESTTSTTKKEVDESTEISTTTEKHNQSNVDDSQEISAENNQSVNSSYVIKGYQYNDNMETGDKISYTKKGDAIKRRLTFTKKDDFNERDYLIGEYGPVGIEYCATEDGSKVKHSFSKWEITKPSTCKDRGEKIRECSICHAVQTCPVPKSESHDCKLVSALEKASYFNKGRFSYQCTTCGEYFERTQPKVKSIVLSQDVFYYNGRVQKPEVIAVLDAKGDEIPKESYVVKYIYPDSKNVYQEYCVAVYFKSNFFSEELGTNYYIRPNSNNIKGISSGKNSLFVYWDKNSLSNINNTTGYEIEYSLNQDFSNSTKIKVKGVDTLSKSIENLSSNKLYYVRMRVYFYDEVSSKIVYSYWSNTRAVKTK